MKRRRIILSATAAGVICVGGATVLLAGAADAHTPAQQLSSTCDDGVRTVTLSLSSSDVPAHVTGTVTLVSSTDGDTWSGFPAHLATNGGGSATQTVGSTAGHEVVTTHWVWSDGFTAPDQTSSTTWTACEVPPPSTTTTTGPPATTTTTAPPATTTTTAPPASTTTTVPVITPPPTTTPTGPTAPPPGAPPTTNPQSGPVAPPPNSGASTSTPSSGAETPPVSQGIAPPGMVQGTVPAGQPGAGEVITGGNG